MVGTMIAATLLGWQPECAGPQALAADLAGWTRPDERLESLGAVTLVPRVSQPMLDRLPRAGRPGGAAAISFQITTPGNYGVAVDQRAWVDVFAAVGDAALPPVASVSHGHGPSCSGIRKIVRFSLSPGRYVLHVTGITGPSVRVMLVPGGGAD